LATATSRSRSPSKSPPASATGPLPVAYEAPLVNALPSSRLSELPAWSVYRKSELPSPLTSWTNESDGVPASASVRAGGSGPADFCAMNRSCQS